MDAIVEALTRGFEQLLGRWSGPFHLRLIITPVVAMIFAIRAGLKDARRGQPPFLLDVVTNPAERRRLLESGWKDIGKMLILAFVIDTVYQIAMFRAFYVIQTLILAVVIAIVPYSLVRGVTNRLTRGRYRHKDRPVTP